MYIYRSNRYEACNRKKLFIYVANSFQNDDMEIRYDCVECYHILCMYCANGIAFAL